MKKVSEPIRLQVYMARCGIASRRASETIIREGRVTVNGEITVQLGTKVSEIDDIRVDGRRISVEKDLIYVALNKPKRYICSSSDPEGRPLAIDLLKAHFTERLFSVGRLDFMSSGLIFYTNDGEFARLVSHPSSEIEKEYRVDAKKPIPEDLLESYMAGITLDDESFQIKEYRYKNPRSVRLVLSEGKNREIRRVFAHWHIALKRIHRVRIGIVRLLTIPPGQYRPLSRKEIDWFVQYASSRRQQ